jgi:hypothetical protein
MPITSAQFLQIVDTTQPNSVNIWYSEEVPLTVYGLTIPAIDNNGNDSSQLLLSAQQINITINGYNYTFVIQSRSSRAAPYQSPSGEELEVTYYFFEITPIVIDSLADDTSIIYSQIVVAIPDTTDTIFFGGDYDALLNNVQDNRESTNIMVADRYEIRGGPGSANPTNIDDLITLTAQKADIQDSNYSTTGWINSRYEGTPTDSRTYGGLDSAITGKTFEGSYFPSSITTEAINNQISSSTILYTDYLSTSQDDLPSQPPAPLPRTKYVVDSNVGIFDNNSRIVIEEFPNLPQNFPDIYIGDIITMSNGNTANTFTEYMRVDNIQPLLFTFGFIELTVTRRWNGSPFGLFSSPSSRAIYKIPNLTKIYQLNGNKIQGISRGRLVIKESSEILAVDSLGQVVVV